MSENTLEKNIVLIGMPASGKSSLGKVLASKLGFAHIDTDSLMEAYYACPLQKVADSTTKEEFLDIEAQTICFLQVKRSVISTGGSVVYRDNAMQHLAELGHIVYLDTKLETILARISQKPDRGLAIAPNQTVEDLFFERNLLYNQYANSILNTNNKNISECVQEIIDIITHS